MCREDLPDGVAIVVMFTPPLPQEEADIQIHAVNLSKIRLGHGLIKREDGQTFYLTERKLDG